MGDQPWNWVEMYRPIFIDYLNLSATFLSKLHFISVEQQHELSSRTQRQQAVTEWLLVLERRQHDNGIYAEVIRALEASGQNHIAEMIENGQTASNEILQRNKRIIEIFSPKLVNVTPVEMLPYLPCLTDEEQGEIQTCKEQHGDHQAAMKMLSFLILRGQDMYGQLTNALEKTNHEELAKDMKDLMDLNSPLQESDPSAMPSTTLEHGENGHDIVHFQWPAQVPALRGAVSQVELHIRAEIRTREEQISENIADLIKQYHRSVPEVIIHNRQILYELVTLFTELGLLLSRLESGSLHFYVSCSDVRSLEDTWNRFQTGKLGAQLSKVLLTENFATDKELEQLTLIVDIEDGDYRKARDLLKAKGEHDGKDDVKDTLPIIDKSVAKSVDSGGNLNPHLNNMSLTTPDSCSSHPTEAMNVETEEKDDQSEPSKSDDKDLPSPPKKVLELRSYQLELAKPALQGPNGGKNTVIVAPTGCGKTIVGVKVAMDFLNYEVNTEGATNAVLKALPKKVVFLVNQVPLVEQQSKVFQTFMGSDSVIGLSGESAHGPLKPILEAKSVLVMTAQILVNGLQDHTVELSDIGLLILDECHNCQKNAPYNKIMAGYRDMKLASKEPRPQILGMTASLDIAQSKSDYMAESKILQLCANLDAEVISTVQSQECLEELAMYQNIPTEDIVEVAGRSKDLYAEEINIIMEKIEKVVECTAMWDKLMEYKPELKLPSSRGTQTYEQWVVQMQDAIAVTTEDKAERRKLMACTDHLKAYNDSLYINRDIRTRDALSQLNNFMDDLYKLEAKEKEKGEGTESALDETDMFLLKLFTERKEKLKSISEDPSSRNPVLNMLGTILLKAFETTDENQEEKCGILFAKTRASTEALQKWIKETDYLKFLEPGRLIGSGGSGGMTQHQQVDLLEMFREGGHKLIVATSVAQEGLDIAQCNVVVRYNHISSVVAHVQARGRNRAKGGQFYLVVDEQLKLKDKDLMNRIREQMMLKATKTIQKRLLDEKEDFLAKIIKLQKEDQIDRKLKSMKDETKSKKKEKKRVKLTCRKCGELACQSDDIRSIKDAHHIVIADEFIERYDTKDNDKFPMLVDDFDFQKTIVCKKCKTEWGTLGLYKGMTLPLLRIAGFVVEYSNGKKQRTKKWKDVLFKVEPISVEDLEKVVNIDNDDDEEEEDKEEGNEEREQ